jgi:dipeptidyl aminopeptidase/acylaminoacyl peptidase
MSNPSLPFTLEQLADIEHPSEAQLSPDGKHVAFVLGKANKPDKDTPSQKAIYIVEVETRKQRRFTASDTDTNDQSRWSPDGKRLAFVSNRGNRDEAQLYVLELDGGEAQALTDLRGKVDSPQWSSDGCWIAFLYEEKQADADPIVADAHPPFKRVYLLNVESCELRPVTPETCHVFEYVLAPDGKNLAVLTSEHPNPSEGWYAGQLHSVDLASGTMQKMCHMPHQIGRLSWSPDSVSLAFVSGVMSDEGNISGEIYIVPVTGGDVRNLTPNIDHSITWIEWRDEGILYGGRHIESSVLGWIDTQTGEQRLISRGMYAINGVGAQQVSAQNGTFTAVRDSFTETPNIYIGSINSGEWERLTDLPINKEAFPPLRAENIEWTGVDGMPVQGFLIYPPNYQAGKKYPLFLHVHGGPSWSYVPRYVSSWERLMAARGCLVLMPNPRGSWGRGHAYQSANVGDLGGGDWQDINAGVDCLISMDMVDAEHMAIGGWSYGGYLVTWAVTQTDRFRCAIAGASITSYESNYGVVSNREWQTTMFGSNVYDDYELHRSRSPIAFVNRVKTPTLLVHGEEDTVAPPQQAIEFYTALKYFNVPTQLALYPREPHGFTERAHQIDLHQRMLGWVDKYLF